MLYLELDYAFEFIINTKHRLLPGAFQHFKLMCYELSPYSTIHQIEQCDNNSSVSFIATVYNLPLVPRGLAQNNELFLAIVSSIDKLLITYLKVADML